MLLCEQNTVNRVTATGKLVQSRIHQASTEHPLSFHWASTEHSFSIHWASTGRPLGNHWASTENYQCALYLARHRQPSDRQRKLHRGINVKIAWQCCCANETLARTHSSCSWGLNCQPRSPKQNLQSSAHWLVEAPPNAQNKESPARKKTLIY